MDRNVCVGCYLQRLLPNKIMHAVKNKQAPLKTNNAICFVSEFAQFDN